METARQLAAIRAGSDELGADILDFQQELLADDHLLLEMLDKAVADGDPAGAVRTVLDEQIASYRGAESERFAARAADLADLKERLFGTLAGRPPRESVLPPDTLLLVDDLTPSRFLELDRSRLAGIADLKGSAASHVSLLARTEGIPMLVGIQAEAVTGIGQQALLDATGGELVIGGEHERVTECKSESSVSDAEGEGAALLPNGERVEVNLIVNSLDTLAQTPPNWFNGIGLVRSELLVRDAGWATDRERQRDAYRKLFEWAEYRAVSIRLFDGGGDKPLPGLSARGSGGRRGARLLMQRTDIVRAQLAAIMEAAAGRAVRVLVPMATIPEELQYFRAEFDRACEAAGAGGAQAKLGMMVETPAAALTIAAFDADFYALGTNDLTQYTMAMPREAGGSTPGEAMPAAVLELVRRVIGHAGETGRPVTLCGDFEISRQGLGPLLECGVRSFCVPARLSPLIKQFIRTGL